MPSNRRPLKRNMRARRFTPEIVALFVRIEEIRNAGDDREWEEQGGRRREFSMRRTSCGMDLGSRGIR
jgi:hypothetical protein